MKAMLCRCRAGLRRLLVFVGTALLLLQPAMALPTVSKLAEKLLTGDPATRKEAIQEFNKLPPEEQYKLVPDFMVALTDENPEVRKIAARILKAMGVKTENQIPDAKADLPPVQTEPPAQAETPAKTPSRVDQWMAERKMRDEEGGPAITQDLAKSTSTSLSEDSGRYDDLKQQIEIEKKGQVTLDAAELRSDSPPTSAALSSVVDSLKDPDPWVRAQAARRLALIRPAPMEAIPTLIGMLSDKEPESRRAAVAALGSFGHLAQQAILPLNSALSDPDPVVKTLAAESLKQIQQPQ